jgi:hypothetical protein
MQGVEPVAFHQPDQQADGHAPHLGQGLSDGGEHGAGCLGQVDVVEACDGQILGHAQAALRGGGQRPDGGFVIEADQRGGRPRQVEQFAGGLVTEAGGRLAGAGQGSVGQHPGIGER